VVHTKSQEISLQERQKRSDDVIHKISQLVKDWEERLTFDNPQFIERFLASEIQFLIVMRINDSFDDPIKVWIAGLEPIPAVETGACKQVVIPDSEKVSVLVDVIKIMESPERIIPALVRLERIDGPNHFRKHSLYFSNLQGFVYLDRFRNWECNVAVGDEVRGSTSDKSYLSKMPSEMVQGASEVLQNVPCCSNDIERKNRERRKAEIALSSLRIVMRSDNIHVLLPNRASFGVEFCEVLFGPFNLHPDEHKAVIGR